MVVLGSSAAQATPGQAQRLTYSQIKALWIQNGGAPQWAPLMAGIALAESGGNTGALNNNPATKDYSVGLWQTNYFGSLLAPRSKQYGTPAQLQANPNLQAKSAISLFGNGPGITNWTGDAVAKSAVGSVTAGSPPTDTQVAGILAANKIGMGGGPAGSNAPATGATQATLLSVNNSSGTNYTGPGAWLIQLDAAVNPVAPAPGTLEQVLGPLDLGSDSQKAAAVAEMLFVRGGIALISLGVLAVGLSALFGKEVTQVVGGKFGIGGASTTAERVAGLATDRANAIQSQKSSAQRERDAAATARERERQDAITRRTELKQSQSLERLRLQAELKAKQTANVGRRSSTRIKEEQAKAETVRQRRLHTQAKAKASRQRSEKSA